MMISESPGWCPSLISERLLTGAWQIEHTEPAVSHAFAFHHTCCRLSSLRLRPLQGWGTLKGLSLPYCGHLCLRTSLERRVSSTAPGVDVHNLAPYGECNLKRSRRLSARIWK